MTQAITPSEVAEAKQDALPDWVIRAWNEMIAEHYVGGESCFTQRAIVDRLKAKAVGAFRISDAWLNVEELYRSKGWHVTYDKPGYNESYEASFTFKAAR